MMSVEGTIRELLVAATTSTYTQVGIRVYAGSAPDDFVNSQKVIMFTFEDLLSDPDVEEHSVLVVFDCFGGDGLNKTHVNAKAVAVALYDTIHGYAKYNTVKTSGTLLSAVQEGYTHMIDPDAGYHFIRCVYAMLLRPNT